MGWPSLVSAGWTLATVYRLVGDYDWTITAAVGCCVSRSLFVWVCFPLHCQGGTSTGVVLCTGRVLRCFLKDVWPGAAAEQLSSWHVGW
jgi:hypothetical protein